MSLTAGSYLWIMVSGGPPTRYGFFSDAPVKGLDRKRAGRIIRSVRRGEAVLDLDDAALAVEVADWITTRRPRWWAYLVPIGAAALLLGPFIWAWLRGDPVPRAHLAVIATFFVVLPTLTGLLMARDRRRARRSREANLRLLDEAR